MLFIYVIECNCIIINYLENHMMNKHFPVSHKHWAWGISPLLVLGTYLQCTFPFEKVSS